MKRVMSVAVIMLGISVALLTGVVSVPAFAAPAPQYVAVLGDDGACQFGLVARWWNAPVATVYAQWYLDSSFLFTMQAPGTGPNAGTIVGHTAVFQAGPFVMTTDGHSWQVLVQFYSSSGAQLASILSNVDVAPCNLTG